METIHFLFILFLVLGIVFLIAAIVLCILYDIPDILEKMGIINLGGKLDFLRGKKHKQAGKDLAQKESE